MRIPLSSPDITEAEIEAVVAVLRTNTLSLGPKLEEFENAFAAYHSIPHAAPYAIAVSSGTAALHLAIRALNLGPGDEVILPSFTFIAVANAVRYEQATPVYADIDPITLNLDPASVEAAITPRTRALIVVHTFGVPADMNALMHIARAHNLYVIEDACEAIGATYNRQRVGTFGDIATFAFYPNKQITTGEGGMLLCRDRQLASRMRALRNQGRYPGNDWLQHQELGYNYRLSELACALGIVQLNRIEDILAKRTAVAAQYQNLLTANPAIELPLSNLVHGSISWFVYVIRIHNRDNVLARLTQRGIGCARYFAPIHQQPAYRDRTPHPILPITELTAQRTLALPFHNSLSIQEAGQVAEALSAALRLTW